MKTEPTPQAFLTQMMFGQIVPRSVAVIAELGIPDRLADESRSARELAADLDLDADALVRVLRLLVMAGVFASDAPGRFRNTALGHALRTGSPGSIRDHCIYLGSDEIGRAWERLPDVLADGKPGFERAMGADFWAHVRNDATFGTRFHRAMTSRTVETARALAGAADLARFRTVVDVGGGQGVLLAELLKQAPHLSGTLFDQPGALAEAADLLARYGVAERCTTTAGDFFDAVPTGHDLYLLKNILHDWADAPARAILATCRRALRSDSELWILEAVLPNDDSPHPARLIDAQMLVALGGRERSEDEWRALLSRAELRLEAIVPLPGATWLLRAVAG